jgi:hypothetical protein
VPEHFISRPAGWRHCRRCGAWLLTAVSEGVPVHVDLVAVNPLGELVAHLTGRHSYTLTGGELIHRDADRRQLDGPVLITHRCGEPIPAAHHAPAIFPPLGPADDPADDTPPY